MQTHLSLYRPTVLLQILESFLDDTEQTQSYIWVNMSWNVLGEKIDLDTLPTTELPTYSTQPGDEPQLIQRD